MPKRPATAIEAQAWKRARLHPYQIEAAKLLYEAHMMNVLGENTHVGIFDMLGLSVLYNVNIYIVWPGF